MSVETLRNCTGLVASVLCTMLSGIFLAFNVYAVQLKAKMRLNQTQVELLGSFALGGLGFSFLGYMLIDKYGYRKAYAIAWILVTSSNLLMWLATLYTDFFRDWIAFLCLFLAANTIGAVLCEVCCLSIAVSLFHIRHVGKVTGLYLAMVSVGKIYYAAMYEFIFLDEEGLGGFFLSIPVGFTLTITVCVFCHKPGVGNDKADSEHMPLTPQNEDCNGKLEEDYRSMEIDSRQIEHNKMSTEAIVKSWFFHFFLWPNAFFCGCAATFMNNITGIVHDFGIEQSERIVYILSVSIMITRLSCGSIVDFFGTKVAGMCLLIFCYMLFAVGMLLGRFWLTDVTVFILTVLGGIGIGVGFALTLTILVLEFGVEHYAFLLGIFHMEIIFSTYFLQLFTGLTHDYVSTMHPDNGKCYNCFQWSFVLLFCGTLTSVLFGLGDIYIFRTRK